MLEEEEQDRFWDHVFVALDIETGGLEESSPVLQIGAVAFRPVLSSVTRTGGIDELESLNLKLQFDARLITPTSLKLNSYDPEVWWKEALPPAEAVRKLDEFLKRYSATSFFSKKNDREFQVPRIVGHNLERFDLPRMRALFKEHGLWFPVMNTACYDTLTLARWLKLVGLFQVEDLKLSTLSEALGFKANHDALEDARATAHVMVVGLVNMAFKGSSML